MPESVKGQDHGKDEPKRRGKNRTYCVAIKCPNVKLPVSVGISTDKSSFETSIYQGNSFSCAACGQMHVWDKSVAFLLVPKGSYTGEHFENEVLVLDASSFDKCVIRKCDIYLSRGNFRLTNCEISESQFNFTGEAAAVKYIADNLRG